MTPRNLLEDPWVSLDTSLKTPAIDSKYHHNWQLLFFVPYVEKYW